MRKLGGNARLTVDLERQVVVRPNGEEIHFEIDPFRKHLLLNGLDDIGQTMQHARNRSTPTRRSAGAEQPWCPPSLPPEKDPTDMAANKKLLVLPGDGIGPEVMREVRRVIDWMDRRRMVSFDITEDLVGGAAIDARGTPITDETMQAAKDADAILFGSVGGPQWDKLGFDMRPEIAILRLRKELGPVRQPAPGDRARSAGRCLHAEARGGARPRSDDRARKHRRHLFRRAARRSRPCRTASSAASTPKPTPPPRSSASRASASSWRASGSNRVTSVEKANVMQSGLFWRQTVTALHAREYADVALSHMYADNCAMQLVRNPRQFDVIVTSNIFGDLLSDLASMLTGSLGHAALRDARRACSRPASGTRCMSRSTAARRTSPARASPIRWRRC